MHRLERLRDVVGDRVEQLRPAPPARPRGRSRSLSARWRRSGTGSAPAFPRTPGARSTSPRHRGNARRQPRRRARPCAAAAHTLNEVSSREQRRRLSPAVSSRPSIRFTFWIAWPDDALAPGCRAPRRRSRGPAAGRRRRRYGSGSSRARAASPAPRRTAARGRRARPA